MCHLFHGFQFYQSRQTIFVWQIEHISQNALYFQGVRLEPKAENELLIQHGLINGLGWIIMKQMITFFVFTAHVRIKGTFYQMISAGSMKKWSILYIHVRIVTVVLFNGRCIYKQNPCIIFKAFLFEYSFALPLLEGLLHLAMPPHNILQFAIRNISISCFSHIVLAKYQYVTFPHLRSKEITGIHVY